MSNNKVQELINEHEARYADLRFCDSRGKEHHLTIPVSQIDENFFERGQMFDGSSIAGWKGINESDMVLMPDPEASFIDPFFDDATVIIRCDVLEPNTMQGYSRDPRSLGKRAEEYLKSTGIADKAFFGPEPEFFIFDDVRWGANINSAFYEIDSTEGGWNSERDYEDNNMGHRPGVKGGYFPVPPVDALHNIRAAMCDVLEEIGIPVEVHHHEVATAGQCEIGTAFNTLVRKADEILMLKYVVQNVAHGYGKTATFMPKPLVGDNGSGMHVHQSLAKDGKNLFTGDKYGGLSQLALYYIGGIFKHAKAINAFTYSARNRSASCRIPFVANPKGRRIEIRFPDAISNPYFAFAAMMMAGLDGIQNKIDPGAPADKDLYDLEPEEAKEIPTVCSSLDQALEALDNDRDFLKAGGVFSDDLIDGYIKLKMEEVTKFRMTTHPVEFAMYYSQ